MDRHALTTDVLVITYDRPSYTRLSVTNLLKSCDTTTRVWLWHNGGHDETLEVVKSLANHPRVFEFHHSKENQRLREPTNWLWANAKGELLAKVDDDCVVPLDWATKLKQAHDDNPRFGAIACWHFNPDDFRSDLANRKIRSFNNGHRVLVHPWVCGSGYVMKRECVQRHGLLQLGQTFTDYCIQLSLSGYINGWYFPLLYQEHMDDPRATHTLIRSDEDLRAHLPLSAANSGAKTVAEWTAQLQRSAQMVLAGSADPRQYIGWRRKLRTAKLRILRAFGGGRYLD